MTSSKTPPPEQIFHDYRWQTFIVFTLPGQPHSIDLTTDLVLGAVQVLNWPPANLEQLKLALVKAIQNAQERRQLNGSAASLIIRVLIPGNDWTTGADIEIADGPREHQATKERAYRIGQPPSRGWGFFLIAKSGSDSGRDEHRIDLYLYPGGKWGK